MRVYIAAPYTAPDQAENVRNAIVAFLQLADAGHVPFCPHLYHFLHMFSPREYAYWMRQDIAWLDVCEVLVRLPGNSKGADTEEARARARGIPVFYSVGEFLVWATQ